VKICLGAFHVQKDKKQGDAFLSLLFNFMPSGRTGIEWNTSSLGLCWYC